jgi:hypothetical protein
VTVRDGVRTSYQASGSDAPDALDVVFFGGSSLFGAFQRDEQTIVSQFARLAERDGIINTSFNVRGEPIVCTPEDAYRCFMRTEMDHLVLGSHLLDKSDQPAWTEDRGWQEDHVLD